MSLQRGPTILEQSQLGFIGVRPTQFHWAPQLERSVLGLIMLCCYCLEIFEELFEQKF